MQRVFSRVVTCGLLASCWLCASQQRALADTPNQLFVERAYHDLLGRVPDETGLSGYANALDQNTLTTAQVAGSITSSPEFHGIETRQQYEALLHRDPDSLSLNGWVNALGAGETVEQLQSNLAGSPEYYTNRAGGTDSGFVTTVYSDLLGRSTSPTERAFALAELSGGESRSNFAAGILSATEYDQRLVNGYYPRFLHRPADPTGLSVFTNQLQSGARDEQVMSELVGTTEYYNLRLLAGDTNFDQSVNFTDLLALAQNYGQKGAHWFDGDFNNDGLVNFSDLLLLAQNYGRSASIATVSETSLVTVPEPFAAPALLGIAAFSVRRKRSDSSARRDCTSPRPADTTTNPPELSWRTAISGG